MYTAILLFRHDANLYEGTERLFRPNYTANLVSSWIPALDEGKIEEKLKSGANVADVGCGHGPSIGFSHFDPSNSFSNLFSSIGLSSVLI